MSKSDELRNALQSQQDLTQELNIELDSINELIRELQERKSTFLNLREESRSIERILAQDLQITLRKEEDEVPFEEIEPFLRVLNSLSHADKLFPFQHEDLAFQFGRFARRTKYKGVLNANATGLGKSAETVMFIRTLQAMQESTAQ